MTLSILQFWNEICKKPIKNHENNDHRYDLYQIFHISIPGSKTILTVKSTILQYSRIAVFPIQCHFPPGKFQHSLGFRSQVNQTWVSCQDGPCTASILTPTAASPSASSNYDPSSWPSRSTLSPMSYITHLKQTLDLIKMLCWCYPGITSTFLVYYYFAGSFRTKTNKPPNALFFHFQMLNKNSY